MTHDALQKHLQKLEEELHHTETRRNHARLESLLHADFVELGRSGRVYTRSQVLEELAHAAELPRIHAQDYALAQLGEDVALLTYRSARMGEDGALQRHTLRASLWVRTERGWQARFHQGTPAVGE